MFETMISLSDYYIFQCELCGIKINTFSHANNEEKAKELIEHLKVKHAPEHVGHIPDYDNIKDKDKLKHYFTGEIDFKREKRIKDKKIKR